MNRCPTYVRFQGQSGHQLPGNVVGTPSLKDASGKVQFCVDHHIQRDGNSIICKHEIPRWRGCHDQVQQTDPALYNLAKRRDLAR